MENSRLEQDKEQNSVRDLFLGITVVFTMSNIGIVVSSCVFFTGAFFNSGFLLSFSMVSGVVFTGLVLALGVAYAGWRVSLIPLFWVGHILGASMYLFALITACGGESFFQILAPFCIVFVGWILLAALLWTSLKDYFRPLKTVSTMLIRNVLSILKR